MVAELERRGIQVSPPNNTVEYSDEYYKANKQKIREKALNLDSSALMTLFKKNKAIENGEKDVKKTVAVLESQLKPAQEFKYTINYPDGSSVTFSGETTEDIEQDSSEVVTNIELPGPWSSEGEAFYVENDNTFGNKVTKTNWEFFAGVSYARVGDTLRWGIILTQELLLMLGSF